MSNTNHIISATIASRSLSLILNKVHYQGESYIIKRGKEIIAKIVPAASQKNILKISELNHLFQQLPHLNPDEEYAFENDLKAIRKEIKPEDSKWD